MGTKVLGIIAYLTDEKQMIAEVDLRLATKMRTTPSKRSWPEPLGISSTVEKNLEDFLVGFHFARSLGVWT